MPETIYSIRVRTLPAHGRYAWVIMKWISATDAVEIGSSSMTFDRPSQAMRAGEQALLLQA
jgi:hypothetical protein